MPSRAGRRARALGVDDVLAHGSIRFSVGRFNTKEEIDFVIERVAAVVKEKREISPLYEMARKGVDLSKVEWAEH